MYFSDYLEAYLPESLVNQSSVGKTERDKISNGVYSRLRNIARERARCDPRRNSRMHGLLVVIGDFSEEIISVDPPKKIFLPEIIGRRYDDGPFSVIHPETNKSANYDTITRLWDALSFIDLAWLIHIDGTMLGANYDLDVSTKDVSIDSGCGKGNKSAKAYSSLGHVTSCLKLSGELGKIVREYVGFKQTRIYKPYDKLEDKV